MPGRMDLPVSTPASSMAVKVTAPARWMMMSGGWNSSRAATAVAIKSLPTAAAFSTRRLSPVLMPAPTRSGAHPQSSCADCTRVWLSCGTTEEITAPSRASVSAPAKRSTWQMRTAYSCAVLPDSVPMEAKAAWCIPS